MTRHKGYIILGKRKDGSYVGYVENSFSMGFDNKRVSVWRHYGPSKHSDRSPQQQKQDFMDNVIDYKNGLVIEHPQIEWNIYRVGSKGCPVKIHWKEFWHMYSYGKEQNHRREDRRNYYDKYKGRNLRFKSVDQ